MPREGRHSLSVYDQVYEIAYKRFESDKQKQLFEIESKKQGFTKWVSDYLLMNLERDKFLKLYAPYLSKVGIEGNRLTIRDENTKSYHDVYLHDHKLVCETDNSDSCIHVRFALALPELGKLKSEMK